MVKWLVCGWSVCGWYVVAVCGQYVVGMWLVCGWYVVGVWSVCGWYVVGVWLVCGQHVFGQYVVGMWSVCGWCVVGMRFNPFTAKGEFEQTKKMLNPELSNVNSKGVTTQMKALHEYFIMVVVMLLLNRVYVFANFMFNLNTETWQ